MLIDFVRNIFLVCVIIRVTQILSLNLSVENINFTLEQATKA